MTSTHREWSPRSHHPLPQYLFNKLNIMSEREVRTRQTDKPFLNFSKPSWDKTCLSCLTWRDHLPQSAATASPLTGCHRGRKSMFSYCQAQVCQQSNDKSRSGKKATLCSAEAKEQIRRGCDGACFPGVKQMRVISLLLWSSQMKKNSCHRVGETCRGVDASLHECKRYIVQHADNIGIRTKKITEDEVRLLLLAFHQKNRYYIWKISIIHKKCM